MPRWQRLRIVISRMALEALGDSEGALSATPSLASLSVGDFSRI